jgi:hypothetical protein
MQLSQVQKDSTEQELVPNPFQFNKAFEKAVQRLDPALTRNGDQRAHLEAGIFQKKIEDAYFDATEARMEPNECVRDAIREGARSMLNNRGAELRGMTEEDLVSAAWERIRNGVESLHCVSNFKTRSQHVVAVCTRIVTDLAYEFWRTQADKTVARG